jgi:hypothetical protein
MVVKRIPNHTIPHTGIWALMKLVRFRSDISIEKIKNNENVYCLEHIKVPQMFFTPQHRWHHQVDSLIITAQRMCGFRSLLLKRNNNCNSGIQSHFYDVI